MTPDARLEPDQIEADQIEPDTKDWTWVLETCCAECGFDPETVTRENVAGRLRAAGLGWPTRLKAPDARRRPRTGSWSPAEYGAHVADVGWVMSERLALILAQDDPLFANWDQDAAALEGHYNERDTEEIARDAVASIEVVATAFAAVPNNAWDRPGRRSNGSRFTAFTLGVYALRDLEHRVRDVA